METGLEENNLNIEYFEPENHYETICKWWTDYKWTQLPLEALPKTGIVVKYDNDMVCAGFLYKTDSCIAWPEFFVSNPHFREKGFREAALTMLLKKLLEAAKESGFKICFSSVNNYRLRKRLKDVGFELLESNMCNMIKAL